MGWLVGFFAGWLLGYLFGWYTVGWGSTVSRLRKGSSWCEYNLQSLASAGYCLLLRRMSPFFTFEHVERLSCVV